MPVWQDRRAGPADLGSKLRFQWGGHGYAVLLQVLPLCYLSCTPRLKQERELALSQLSQGLATELTELVLTECVREACAGELR